ncbi:MAG: DUF721 domain-containing protein [Ilumatobacteraceae bacterium]
MVQRRNPGAWDGDPVPVTAALDDVMRSLRGTDRRQVGGLFGRWDEIVGATIAAHVRPVRLDERVLVVEVDEPAWATQVSFLSDNLRTRLVSEIGVEVDRLDVRVARGPKPRARDTPLVD